MGCAARETRLEVSFNDATRVGDYEWPSAVYLQTELLTGRLKTLVFRADAW